MGDCVFCRIQKGEIPAQRVFESDRILAILDINPLSFGHTLVMPKVHHDTLSQVPAELAAEVFQAVQRIAAGVMRATGSEGYNVLMNNGRCSGQAIDHAHLHVIPRRQGDQIRFGWNVRKYGDGEMEKTADAIRTALK